MQVIVFVNDNKVSIISPSPDCDLTIEEIADKDVPMRVVFEDGGYDENGAIAVEQQYSRPYLIIDDSELPDRELRDRWVIQDGKVIIADEVENS